MVSLGVTDPCHPAERPPCGIAQKLFLFPLQGRLQAAWFLLSSHSAGAKANPPRVYIEVKSCSLLQTRCCEDFSQPQVRFHAENPFLGHSWQHRLQLAPGTVCFDLLFCCRTGKISSELRTEGTFQLEGDVCSSASDSRNSRRLTVIEANSIKLL